MREEFKEYACRDCGKSTFRKCRQRRLRLIGGLPRCGSCVMRDNHKIHPRIGKKRGPMSEEQKRKISISKGGRKPPPPLKKKGNPLWVNPMKGRPLSEEHRAKLSTSHIGLPVKGRVWSAEDRIRQSERQKGRPNPSKGKKRPHLQGENCPRWKGGVTPANVLARGSMEYKAWRMAIFRRDWFRCQLCGSANGGHIQADHILSWSEYPEYRFDIRNGRTLCVPCHKTKTAAERKAA